MSKQVLNRPMFAKMRDGSVKPVQYAFNGKYIYDNINSSAGIPYNLKSPSQVYKPSLGELFTGIPYNLPKIKPNVEEKISVSDIVTEERPKNSPSSENIKPKLKPKPKPKPDGNDLGKKIKAGDLDELITERIGIFEKYLGDGKDKIKSGGFAALTEFGLNLASARGGNFLDKVARSAKDPLKTFTAIGMAAKDRADKIKMAGIEAGIKADEAQKERDFDAAASGENTTFQNNLATLTTMFTDKDTKQLTIEKEDLVNMAKTGGTTTKKEFLNDNYKAFAGKQNPISGTEYTQAEVAKILNDGWALVSGEQVTETSGDGSIIAITTQDEFEALAPNTLYIGPDGQTYRKGK